VGWVAWDVTRLVASWMAGTANYGVLLEGPPPANPTFVSSDDAADPSRHPKLTIVYACECGQVCGAGSATRVLYVVADATSLSTQEAAREALMQGWGFVVTLIDDDASQEEFDAEVGVNDAAYVSQEAMATTLGSKLNDSAIGVVNEHKDMIDDFGFATGLSLGGGLPTLNVDPHHYITSAFESSPISPYVANDWYQLAAEPVAAGVDPVGTWVETPWTGKPALMALPEGADLITGEAVAGRRVQIPWGSGQGATPVALDSLSEDARTIMKRSIEWAGGAGCNSLKPLLMVVADVGNPTSQEIARQTLLESWCYAVTRIDDGADQAEYDTATDAADVVHVSPEVLAGEVGTKLKTRTIGVVNEDPGLHPVFGFSSVRYQDTTNAPLTTDAAHYITSPFSGGAVTLYTSDQPSGAAVGTLPSGLEQIGTWSSGALSPLGGLLTLETGAELYGGGAAAGRRVQLPWDGVDGVSVADIDALTDDGRTILQRALEWAAGADDLTGPIAHWKLDETSGTTAFDSAGGHDGTLTNGPSWSPGTIDGGLSFDGSNDFVDVAHQDTLSLATFSISAWVYPAALSGWQIVVNKGTATDAVNYYMGTSDDEISLGFYSGGWVEFTSTSADLSIGRWYHVASTFDDSTGKATLYLDGTPIHGDTTTQHPVPNGQALTLGRSGFGEYWSGMLDDVRLYDRVLYPEEVSELAAMGDSVCAGTFRDEFSTQVWSGSDGTLAWATDWLEWDDDGAPSGGDIMVMDDMGPYSVRIQDDGTGGNGAGIRREADLSAYATATLSFDFRRDGPDNAADYVTVDVSDDGGATWTELDRFAGESQNTEDPTYQSRSYDITDYRAPNTRIRFQSSPDLGFLDAVYFDNVEICVGN
jgi:hypothetical protein